MKKENSSRVFKKGVTGGFSALFLLLEFAFILLPIDTARPYGFLWDPFEPYLLFSLIIGHYWSLRRRYGKGTF